MSPRSGSSASEPEGGLPGSRGLLRVVALGSQAAGVFAFGSEVPRLTWQLAADDAALAQLAYEIQVASDPGFVNMLATSGQVESEAQVGVEAPGGGLSSRETRHYRVRVRSKEGWSTWCEPMRLEAGLLHPADWSATAITLPNDPGRSHQAPSPHLRRELVLDGPVASARLYVTSLGIHEVRINGQRVGDQLLSPGWTTYRHRLLTDTHDVTNLLSPGPNAIGAILGDGWYRGRIGWDPGDDRGRYGTELGLLLQLEVQLEDGRSVTVVSDESWRASTAEVLAADHYDGTMIDLREARPGWDRAGFDDSEWVGARAVPLDRDMLEPRSAPPVRVIDTRSIQPRSLGSGTLRLDAGQNLAGFVRLRVRGARGDRVRVRHAEVVEPDDALHVLALRTARATDEYVLADDAEVTLEPRFTFHGFRYADVESDAEVLEAQVVAISSDLRRRSSFACSDDRLNRLHENVLWSLRGNFVAIPTDCPQRDERLGWTGDAQAFAPTACTLVGAETFWQSWLRDLELDQDDDLGVPSVVPDVVLGGDPRYGRAGWADAATMVPWSVYESYGDLEILRRQLGSMRRWVDSLVRRQADDGLLPQSWQFGDWLDPDAPPERPWEAKADSTFIANAFFVHSARLLADAADLLGEPGPAGRYRDLARQVADAAWARWSSDIPRTQTTCAIALQLGVVPAGERDRVLDALAALVDDADGRVATGFLGTPLVLPALAVGDRFDQAYRMLLCTQAPSWLYQVEQGATTVWERWDAIRPDGSIHPGTMSPVPGAREGAEDGHMLSFNHYAYGAVIDWVYRHVAGIAPEAAAPGYRRIRFAPRPVIGMSWARAAVETPFGRSSIDWRLEDDTLVADLTLPIGTTGVLVPPMTATSEVEVDGRRMPDSGHIPLTAGRHLIRISAPLVARSGAGRPVAAPSSPGS